MTDFYLRGLQSNNALTVKTISDKQQPFEKKVAESNFQNFF